MDARQLFAPEDTRITVGTVRQGEGEEIPVFIMAYEEGRPSCASLFERYPRIILDVAPTDAGGYKYYVRSTRAVSVLTPEMFAGFNGTTAEDLLRTIRENGVPEFSAMVDVSRETHERFMRAKENVGGSWLLVALTADATQVLIDANGDVASISTRARADYGL